MPPRTRTVSDYEITNGFWRRFGSTSSQGQLTRGRSSCDDLTGQGDCDHFVVDRYSSDGGVISQPHDGGWWAAYFSNYVADGCGETNFPHIGMSVPIPTSGESAIRGINMTSPSRAYVDVPVNVLQLGELVHLLRDVGKSLISRIGSTNLKYQFGIAPLVGDLVKLVNFNDQVERRIKQINKLVSKGGLRQTVDIGSYENSVNDTMVFQSQGAFISAPRVGHTELQIRVHCRWTPYDLPAFATPKSIQAMARKAVLGSTLDAYTVWELMPWSWLIDWGYDLGSYLKAQRNSVPASLSRCVVMEHLKTNWSSPGSTPGDYGRFMSPFHLDRINKRRIIPIVAPSAHFPFLSGNQMGILSSLAIAKMR